VYIAVPLADLAQLVERLIRNQQVAGSSPAVGFINKINNLRLSFLPQNQRISMSNYRHFKGCCKEKVYLKIIYSGEQLMSFYRGLILSHRQTYRTLRRQAEAQKCIKRSSQKINGEKVRKFRLLAISLES
jgi:hypothetical protein